MTKTVAEIVITKLAVSLQFMETPDDLKTYNRYKKFIKQLLDNEPFGVYKITIKRHYLGLYYTFEMRPVFVPAKG